MDRVTQEQFDQALDALCSYEPDCGYSLGDLLGALCVALGVQPPFDDHGSKLVLRSLLGENA